MFNTSKVSMSFVVSNLFLKLLLSVGIVSASLPISAIAQLPNPILMGYWHNWNDNNAPYIHIDSIDSRYNVVIVAFAVPASNTDMTMQFTPDRGTTTEFIQRIQRTQAQGKKVLLSIGGANASVDVSSTTNKNSFINSITSLLNTYSFDGIDIDIENGASILISGGTIASPQNIAQVNLIDAIRQIMASYRSLFARKMLLTMAPETAYIQGGMSGFGSIWGGYLPIVHALRDSIDLLQVQLYNSGTMFGIDGNIYTQGTADFIVAMTEAVIRGFNTSGGVFAGLPPSKIAVGLPASSSASGGGFADSVTIYKAMQYLLGKGSRPGQYILAQQGGYPTLRGMMTWSVNWDALAGNRNKYSFANGFYNLFGPPPLPYPDKVVLQSPALSAQLFSNNTRIQWQMCYPSVTVYQVELSANSSIVLSDSTITETSFSIDNLIPATTYSWRVRAKNSRGWGEWSEMWFFHSMPYPSRVQQVAPDSNAQLHVNTIQLRWRKSIPLVSAYHLIVSYDKGMNTIDTILTDTMFVCKNEPARSYRWRVRAKNISGWSEWSSEWIFRSVPFPSQVVLLSPADTTNLETDSVSFSWEKSQPDVVTYRFEIYNSSNLEFSDSTIKDTTLTIHSLKHGIKYRWRVQAQNESGWGEWSAFRQITLMNDTTVSSIMNDDEYSIHLFPNPVENFLNLSVPEGVSTVLLFNSQGKLVLQNKTEITTIQCIDVSNLPDGVYTVLIGGFTQMFVKCGYGIH